MQANLDYIVTSVVYLYNEIVESLRRMCKSPDTKALYIQACQDGDVRMVNRCLLSNTKLDTNHGLVLAVAHGHRILVELLLNRGATNLNEALKTACVNNHYDIAELLVQKGASVVEGIRVSTSLNITRMLYRYDTKTVNIS